MQYTPFGNICKELSIIGSLNFLFFQPFPIKGNEVYFSEQI